jgi:hypothetical protein
LVAGARHDQNIDQLKELVGFIPAGQLLDQVGAHNQREFGVGPNLWRLWALTKLRAMAQFFMQGNA